MEQSTIDSAAALTNSIEQRAAEIRDLAEEGPAEVNPGPTYGYSKEGKPVVEKEPISPAVQLKRWDVWAVGTGLFGHYDDFDNLHYAAGQFTVGLDYRVMPHWLVGILGDYTYASGSFAGRNFLAVYSQLLERLPN